STGSTAVGPSKAVPSLGSSVKNDLPKLNAISGTYHDSSGTIVMVAFGEFTLPGDIGRNRSDGHIVAVDLDERPVVSRSSRIVEIVMIEVVAPGRLAFVIHPRQQCKALGNFVQVGRVPAGHGAELTLTDQSQSEVGE